MSFIDSRVLYCQQAAKKRTKGFHYCTIMMVLSDQTLIFIATRTGEEQKYFYCLIFSIQQSTVDPILNADYHNY